MSNLFCEFKKALNQNRIILLGIEVYSGKFTNLAENRIKKGLIGFWIKYYN
jgi:hypothetical protein